MRRPGRCPERRCARPAYGKGTEVRQHVTSCSSLLERAWIVPYNFRPVIKEPDDHPTASSFLITPTHIRTNSPACRWRCPQCTCPCQPPAPPTGSSHGSAWSAREPALRARRSLCRAPAARRERRDTHCRARYTFWCLEMVHKEVTQVHGAQQTSHSPGHGPRDTNGTHVPQEHNPTKQTCCMTPIYIKPSMPDHRSGGSCPSSARNNKLRAHLAR